MRECAERSITVGFSRDPKRIFDEADLVTARMAREGWTLVESVMEEGLGKAHLFFEREIPEPLSEEDRRSPVGE